MTTSIFETLEKIGLSSKKSRVLFNNRTRDIDGLKVWKDKLTGVIYIDEFFVGDDLYKETMYLKADFDRQRDIERRVSKYAKFVLNKRIVDFGCGTGDFLREVTNRCEFACGVELSEGFRHSLIEEQIACVTSLAELDDDSLDTIVSFHTIEHLPNPIEILSEMRRKVVSGGHILIEVPHANDFLLSSAACEEFKQFTLWSQHLVLHTRESLRKTLEFVGLKDIQIEGVQRYPLSNHLNWLLNGKPGGHMTQLSALDTDTLFDAYQSSLARIDATDTLVAIAKVP